MGVSEKRRAALCRNTFALQVLSEAGDLETPKQGWLRDCRGVFMNQHPRRADSKGRVRTPPGIMQAK